MTTGLTIIYPNCSTEIKLTEPLVAPLIQTVRKEYEARIAQKDDGMAKRETQIQSVIESTVGMYGDLQKIAGRALQEIEGLDRDE